MHRTPTSATRSGPPADLRTRSGELQAGEGNRTLTKSLEGSCATTTPRPRGLDDKSYLPCVIRSHIPGSCPSCPSLRRMDLRPGGVRSPRVAAWSLGNARRVRGCRHAVAVAACSRGLSAPALAPPRSTPARASRPAGHREPEFVSFGFDISQITERSLGRAVRLHPAPAGRLAQALGPAYVRYSGTKIDETYYDPTGSLGPNPPGAYKFVLGRARVGRRQPLRRGRRAEGDHRRSTAAPGRATPTSPGTPTTRAPCSPARRPSASRRRSCRSATSPTSPCTGPPTRRPTSAADYARDVARLPRL